jgi:DNA polymerase-3 subunit epsilon
MVNKDPIVFLDVETTGKVVKDARVIQFGAFKVFPDRSTKEFSVYIKPAVPVSAEAFAVHHISNDFLKDKPSFIDVADSISDFMSGCHFAGYNLTNFDLPILEYEFNRCNMTMPPYLEIIDLLKLVYKFNPRTLSAALSRYCPDYKLIAHNAYADARACYELLTNMLIAHSEDLEKFSDLTTDTADIAGLIGFNELRHPIFTFGKFKDELISEHEVYCYWMINSGSFPLNTVNFLKAYLKT